MQSLQSFIMQPTHTFKGHKQPIYCIVHGQQDGQFLTGSGDGLVVKWSLDGSHEGQAIVKLDQAVFALHLINERGLLLIGTEGGAIHVIDLRNGEEIKLFKIHEKGVFCFERLKDGWIVAGGGDGTISVWDPATLSLIRQIPIAEGKIRHAAVSPLGGFVALASTDGTVRVLDTGLFNERNTIKAHSKGANCVAWHPKKSILMSAGRDGHIRAWHSEEEYRQVLSIPAHEQTIYRMRFSNTGILATASRDKSAKSWNANDMEVIEKFEHDGKGHTHSVNDLIWIEDRLVTVNDDGGVRVF